MAEGVVELEYPKPNPEAIAKLLHGLRDDERLEILHTDNGNPSIIAENMEESEEITKDTSSDIIQKRAVCPLDSNLSQIRMCMKQIG